ncbi:hypothetical protein LPJ73_000999, partial [Coemansia sp. RSA 2703]
MLLQPAKESEKGGVPSKLADGSAAASSVLVGKQGEWVEPVLVHTGGVGEGQRKAGKVVTVKRMQKIERRQDDVCALLKAHVTGRCIGEGAGPVESQEQLLYRMPGTAVYGPPPFAGGEGSAPGNPRIEAVKRQ